MKTTEDDNLQEPDAGRGVPSVVPRSEGDGSVTSSARRNDSASRLSIGRRRFLQRLAIAGIAVTGGYILYEAAPWLNYEQQADRIWKPLAKETALSAQMRELVRYATLAASGHNTQPWKFVIRSNSIEIHPDYSRRLSVVDPGDRELWISLGCALENLLIAARAAGHASEVTYPDTADLMPRSLRRPAITARSGAAVKYTLTRKTYCRPAWMDVLPAMSASPPPGPSIKNRRSFSSR